MRIRLAAAATGAAAIVALCAPAAAQAAVLPSSASAPSAAAPCSGYRVNQVTGESRCISGSWGISHRVKVYCLNPRTGDHVVTGPWVGSTSRSRATCPNLEYASDIWSEWEY